MLQCGCVDSRKSTLGYIFKLVGGAVSWRSAKQTLVATSTMEAEFISCFEATSHGLWLKSFITELNIVDSISKPLTIYCDNPGTTSSSNCWLFIREKVDQQAKS